MHPQQLMEFCGLPTEPTVPRPSRYVIVAQLKLTSADVLQEAIFKLGTACVIADSAWIVASTYSLAALHNLLIQLLRPIDQLFIIDIARDKASWTSFGPSDEARFRQLWTI
jgi:hypothetical protein